MFYKIPAEVFLTIKITSFMYTHKNHRLTLSKLTLFYDMP